MSTLSVSQSKALCDVLMQLIGHNTVVNSPQNLLLNLVDSVQQSSAGVSPDSVLTDRSNASNLSTPSLRKQYNDMVTSNKEQIAEFRDLKLADIVMRIAEQSRYDAIVSEKADFLKIVR